MAGRPFLVQLKFVTNLPRNNGSTDIGKSVSNRNNLSKHLMLSAAALVLGVGAAQAEFTLDSRDTDADGDMIADIPTDPA